MRYYEPLTHQVTGNKRLDFHNWGRYLRRFRGAIVQFVSTPFPREPISYQAIVLNEGVIKTIA